MCIRDRCTYADARRDYADKWTSEYAMTNSIWEDTAVIGVTPAIYNDTISVSKSSPIMDDDFKAALSQAFINIGDKMCIRDRNKDFRCHSHRRRRHAAPPNRL